MKNKINRLKRCTISTKFFSSISTSSVSHVIVPIAKSELYKNDMFYIQSREASHLIS